MRFSLVGYTGSRPPVPTSTGGVEPPDDPTSDPDFVPPDPLVVILEDGDVFHKLDYLALGYNHFDVICIGGGGGRAGDVHLTAPTETAGAELTGYRPNLAYNAVRHWWGSGGGGGGLHRVKGRLALLPSACDVVVGAAGADGADISVTVPWTWGSFGPPPPPGSHDGLDGGFTSFGGTICRASGGKGGIAARTVGMSYINGGGGHGGEGGVVTPGDHIGQGTWDGIIGKGGAGGSAGNGWGPSFATGVGGYTAGGASAGSKGNYSDADPGWSAPGSIVLPESFLYTSIGTNPPDSNGIRTYYLIPNTVANVPNAIGGIGGGARTFPLDGSLAEWGSGGIQGWCEIRLTYLSL
jgi:hypothetical protein